MPSSQSAQSRLNNSVVCHECDLLVDLSGLTEGHRAQCPRCLYVLSDAHTHSLDRILIFSLSALICLAMSLLFDFVQLSVIGQERVITLPETVKTLFALREWELAVFIGVIIVGLPGLFVSALAWLILQLKWQHASLHSFTLLQGISFLRFWNMAEIFFLGILISMVKVAGLAQIGIGLSFWFYALFNVFMLVALYHVDKVQLTREIRRQLHARPLHQL